MRTGFCDRRGREAYGRRCDCYSLRPLKEERITGGTSSAPPPRTPRSLSLATYLARRRGTRSQHDDIQIPGSDRITNRIKKSIHA